MIDALVWSLIASLALNGILFALAFWYRSDKLTDISYALSFIAVAIVYFAQSAPSAYRTLALGMVAAWAVRIGGFLLFRIIRNGKDTRFDGIRNDARRFGTFWLGQACTAWILMLPVGLAMEQGGQISILALSGCAVWLAGLLIESAADGQKFAFNQDPLNKGQWISSGLWRYSRHPNYFGEILVWVGLYLFAFTVMSPIERLIGLTSPLFITILLLFVSGVPVLEKSADKRWGHDPKYQAYRHQTSLLIPLPPRSRPADH